MNMSMSDQTRKTAKWLMMAADIATAILSLTVFGPCEQGMNCQKSATTCATILGLAGILWLLEPVLRTCIWLFHSIFMAIVFCMASIGKVWCDKADMRCQTMTVPFLKIICLVMAAVSLALLIWALLDRKDKGNDRP